MLRLRGHAPNRVHVRASIPYLATLHARAFLTVRALLTAPLHAYAFLAVHAFLIAPLHVVPSLLYTRLFDLATLHARAFLAAPLPCNWGTSRHAVYLRPCPHYRVVEGNSTGFVCVRLGIDSLPRTGTTVVSL